MIRVLALLSLVMVVAACGSKREEPSAAASSRMEKCLERVLDRAEQAEMDEIKTYARTICERFDERGLVHADGTLKIAVAGGASASMCAVPASGEPVVPCDDTPSPEPTLDCALLDLVRRAEVQAYVKERQQMGPVTCDDGRPLEDLGS